MMAMRERIWKCGSAAAFGAALAAAGCGDGEAVTTADVDHEVAAAYEALVADVAACGADVAQCVRAAQGDANALQICRDQLQDCAAAGGASVGALADAARQCAEDLRACVTGGGDPATCQTDLQACLGVGSAPGTGAAPPAGTGAPAGLPADGVLDCVDELLGCIRSGADPMACAQDVRACVLDALPVPADLTPGAPPAGPGAGAPGATPANPVPPIPAGVPPVPPVPPAGGAAPAPPVPAGAPVPVPDPANLPAPAATAIGCLEALQACVDAGTAPGTCLQEMRECMMSIAP